MKELTDLHDTSLSQGIGECIQTLLAFRGGIV